MADHKPVSFQRVECAHCKFVWWCHPSRIILKCAACGEGTLRGLAVPPEPGAGLSVHPVAALVFQFASALMDDCTYADPGDCWEMARHHSTELLRALADCDPIKVTPP